MRLLYTNETPELLNPASAKNTRNRSCDRSSDEVHPSMTSQLPAECLKRWLGSLCP